MPRIPLSKQANHLLTSSLLCLAGGAAAHAQYSTIPSMPLQTFQDSLGVNVHMEYTDGKYANSSAVLGDLQYLGIHNVRDEVPAPANWLPHGQGVAAIEILAANNIKFNLVAADVQSLSTSMQQLDALVQKNPGSVISIEGPNEINNFPVPVAPGQSEEQSAEAYQRSLYSAVKSDSLFQNTPVLYLTGGAPINLQTNQGLADIANTHPYPHNGEQPSVWLPRDFASYFQMTGTYTKNITETGYYTLPQVTNWGGVDEPTQAELLLNDYFDAALQGVAHTYVYQLLDAYPDPQNNNMEYHFGFFHLDNSPKIIAYAMRHLADVLPADKPSAQQNVQANITGLPSGTGHALALTGSDGSIALFLWNEAPVWNESAESMLLVPPTPVQVQMNGSWNVSYFSPAGDSTVPVGQSSGSYQTYASTYPTALIFRKK